MISKHSGQPKNIVPVSVMQMIGKFLPYSIKWSI